MSTSDRLWSVAAIVLGTSAAILAGLLWSERRDAGAEVAGVAVARGIAKDAKEPPAQAPGARAHPVAGSPEPAVKATKPEKVDANAKREERMRASRAVRQRLYADPESRALLHAEHKREMRGTHPDLARVLKLSAEEEDLFLGVLAEDLMRQIVSQPRERADFTSQQLMLQAEIQGRFGEAKYRQYQRYSETLAERTLIKQFRERLDEANALTPEASERLIEVVATERVRVNAEIEAQQKASGLSGQGRMYMYTSGRPVTFDMNADSPLDAATEELEERDRQLEKVVEPVLTAAQRTAFTEYLVEARENTLAQVELMLQQGFGPRAAKNR